MEKFGKSSDPVQQALRDHKKRWNMAAKEFIKRLIAFKKGVNGRGDPSYGLPTSNIKDPLPGEVATFLNEVSGNFQQLAEEALKIQQEQALYSQKRRKPAPEKPADVGVPTPPTEVPKAASSDSGLIKLAHFFEIKYATGRFEVDLIPPKEIEKGSDDYWMYDLDKIQEVINFFPKLWAAQYQEEFSSYVKGAIQRGKEQIKKDFGKLSEAKHDVVLTLKRTTAEKVYLRGDNRYPSDPMSQYLLTTKYDLVPPIVGASGMGNHLLDGHHRWRAYLLAGIDPLILEIKIEPSHSPIPKIVAVVDNSAMTKIIPNQNKVVNE